MTPSVNLGGQLIYSTTGCIPKFQPIRQLPLFFKKRGWGLVESKLTQFNYFTKKLSSLSSGNPMYSRQPSNTVTYVSSGSEFRGTLTVKKSNLRVDGKIDGTIEVDGDIEVSAEGSVRGPEMRGGNITVNGTVNANVVSEGKLSLSRSARLEGDVVVEALDIAAGASYIGHIVSQNIPGLQQLSQSYSGTSSPPRSLVSNDTEEVPGILQIKGNLRVDGKIFGTVEVEGDIEVATAGAIQGPEIRAVNITIYGKVNANVIAEGKLTLTQTAQLRGDIVASALEMASGASCLGHFVTDPDTPRLLPS